MTTAVPKRANTELVAAAYLRQLLAAYDPAVGAVLQGPNPETGIVTWANSGFVQLSNIGGQIDINVPVRHSVVSLDIYATTPKQSRRPPWGLAFSLAEAIVAASFDTPAHDTHAAVVLPTGFPSARVTEFSVLTEPGRRPSDPSDFAHVGMDVRVAWHGLDNTWTV
jgi:hypothetical protein